jgi:hypothetical protein
MDGWKDGCREKERQTEKLGDSLVGDRNNHHLSMNIQGDIK